MHRPEPLQHLRFPAESRDYRAARNRLLDAEISLRQQTEQVAAERRALPPGGVVTDYEFTNDAGPVRLSALFAPGHDTLAVYSFMFGSERDRPCPGCTHFLDGLNGMAEHIAETTSLAVVAKSPMSRIRAFADERGWHRLTLLSAGDNDYSHDYFGDSSGLVADMRRQQDFKDGEEWDMPMLNVFRRSGTSIFHFWGSEMLYAPSDPGQDYRHNDLLDPLWNLLDVTPVGRGDFQPKLSYV